MTRKYFEVKATSQRTDFPSYGRQDVNNSKLRVHLFHNQQCSLLCAIVCRIDVVLITFCATESNPRTMNLLMRVFFLKLNLILVSNEAFAFGFQLSSQRFESRLGVETLQLISRNIHLLELVVVEFETSNWQTSTLQTGNWRLTNWQLKNRQLTKWQLTNGQLINWQLKNRQLTKWQTANWQLTTGNQLLLTDKLLTTGFFG